MLSILLSVVLVSIPTAHAYLENAKMPICLDGNEEMQIDNAKVLDFKRSTKNQFLARAFVQGTVVRTPEVINHHDHFVISIGPSSKDTIEIIYNFNPEFGPMPDFSVGDDIVVCGDYITSYAKSGRYEASPEGAIIHWVHYNPGDRSSKHEHGFIQLSDRLVGFDDAPSSAWDGTIPNGSGGRSDDDYRGGNRSRSSKKKRHFGDFEPCQSLDECSSRAEF